MACYSKAYRVLENAGWVEIFPQLAAQIEFDPSKDAEFIQLLQNLGVPLESLQMLPSMVNPMLEGMGVKDILGLFDGNLTIYAGTNKACAEIGIDINGIKDFLLLA